MKQTIKLNPGSTVTLDQDNNLIITEKEPKFKDGDIITYEHYIVIYKEPWGTKQGGFKGYYTLDLKTVSISKGGLFLELPSRISTEEETKYFFDILKATGNVWNPITKHLEPLKFTPKNGDICYFCNSCTECVLIYKGTHQFMKSIAVDYYATLGLSTLDLYYDDWCDNKIVRLATDLEKQKLFDALEQAGKQWNPKTLRIEDLRFIPRNGEICYFNNGACERIVIYYKSLSTAKSCTVYTACDLKGYLSKGCIIEYYTPLDNACRRLANTAERQILFDALAKEGKQWNIDLKCIEPLKWRPIMNEIYYYPLINANSLADWHIWKNDEEDNRLLKRNLIFRSEEEAIKASGKMLNVLK